MNFEITADQEALRESVRSVLERECPLQLARDLSEGRAAPSEPWRSARALGWPGIWIEEEHGGLGLGFEELGLVLEEHGRHLAPGPLLATTTAFWPVIREAGSAAQQAEMGAAISAGMLTGTLAAAGEFTSGLHVDAALRATPTDGGYRLEGSRHFVLDGASADRIALVAAVEAGDGCGLFVVDRAAQLAAGKFEIEPVTPMDASRPFATLRFDGAVVSHDASIGVPGQCAPALRRALDATCTALALETVGACDRLLGIVLEHAKSRVQFDQPIGAFQAVQHKCANMYIAIEKARAAGYHALMAIQEDDPVRSLAAAIAKAAAADCQREVAQEAIQIHGGIGFTWESDVHLFVKRAKSNAALFGGAREQRARIAALLEV